MQPRLDLFEDIQNPLDGVEDVIAGYNWNFERAHEDELTVQVAGKFCTYLLAFIWRPEMKSVQFFTQFDFDIHDNNMRQAAAALMSINENLWLGHFEIPEDTKTPNFRYTYLVNPSAKAVYDPMEELVDIALTQCEKYYSTFRLLSCAQDIADTTLPLALMETQGVS